MGGDAAEMVNAPVEFTVLGRVYKVRQVPIRALYPAMLALAKSARIAAAQDITRETGATEEQRQEIWRALMTDLCGDAVQQDAWRQFGTPKGLELMLRAALVKDQKFTDDEIAAMLTPAAMPETELLLQYAAGVTSKKKAQDQGERPQESR